MSHLAHNFEALKRINPSFVAEWERQISDATALEFPGLKNFSRLDGFSPDVGMVVVLGFGDASLIRLFLQQPRVQHVLVYEPSLEFLKGVLAKNDLGEIFNHPKLRLMTGSEAQKVLLQLSRYFYEDSFRLTHVFNFFKIINPGTENIPGSAAAYQAFEKLFLQEIDNKLSRLKPNEEDAFWGMLNVFDNLPEYFSYPHVRAMKKIFDKCPGVVVASGPSLKRNVEILKKYQDRVVIFACDSAAPILIERGVHPDFVATTERVALAQRPFHRMSGAETIPLLASSVIPAKELRAYPGPKLKIHLDNGFDGWFSEGLVFDSIGNIPSVAHLCYTGLKLMGCETVGLLGHDLCYDPKTGGSHDADIDSITHEADAGLTKHDGSKMPVETVYGHDGRERKTMFYWKHFAGLYRGLAARYGGKLYNLIAAEDGIPIDGAERLDPESGLTKMVRDKIDKSGILAIAGESVESGVSRDACHAKLKKLRLILNAYQGTALKTMRELAEAWRDHDPSFPAAKDLGFDEFYRNLFQNMENVLQNITVHEDRFFERHFLKMIMNSLLGLRVERAQTLFREADPVKRQFGLIQNYYKTFNLIQLWSARLLEAMEHHNRERWKIW